jgi:hypothetical protein
MRIRIFLIFLLFPVICFSQEKLPLIHILDAITATDGAKFGYIEEELVVYTLVPPDPKLTLKQKLKYIESKTRIRFEAVSKNFYTVYNDHKMDKPLCGYLIDGDSGSGIENAQVSITETSAATASDKNGYFELPVLSPNHIIVSHLNYKPKTIDPQELYVSICPRILLTPNIEELGEVLTHRYLATGISKNDLGELVVKPGKFGILPGLTEPDVLQTMQQVPGITSDDETISNINVRGGTHDQNKFLLNGIPMFQTGHFFGLISAFNPLSPSSITIYKSGTPAYYGEGVSSVIDISTHTAIPEKSYNIGAIDMISAGFLSKIRISDKAALQISGRRTYSDIYATPTFKDYQHRIFQNTIVTDISQNQNVDIKTSEDFYFYDLSLQYQQKIGNRHEIIIDAVGFENKVGIFQRTAENQRNSHLAQENFGGSINWKSQWNDNNKTEVQGYVSWYELAATNQSVGSEQIISQQNMASDKGVRVKHTHIASHGLELSGGYQFDEIAIINCDEINIPEYSRYDKQVSRTHTGIAEALFRSKNKLTLLRGSIRETYFQKFNLFLTEPRFVFSQALTNVLKLEMIGERKSQTLSQVVDLQQDFLGIEKRRWTLANELDVPIQKSTQASVGLTYSHKGWLIAIDNFYKQVAGITSASQGFQNQFEFIDGIGSYQVLGSEVLLQKSFRRFYGWISYSYNDNKYNFKEFQPHTFANNFEIPHAVTWAGIYEWRKLRIALGGKWHSGKLVTTPASFNLDPDNPSNSSIVYNAPNNTRLGEYIQVNFSASKTWRLNGDSSISLSASVINILNRRNVINRYYRVNTSNNEIESVNTSSLRRTPNVSLKYIF